MLLLFLCEKGKVADGRQYAGERCDQSLDNK